MEGTYEVMLGPERKGTVTVTRQGLYWQFDSRCSLSGEVMYDLSVCVGDRLEKLGLLTPECGRYCLHCKLPVKRLGQGRPVFLLQARHPAMNGQFIPVNPEEPFRYLHRLESAHLAKKEGQIGVVLSE